MDSHLVHFGEDKMDLSLGLREYNIKTAVLISMFGMGIAITNVDRSAACLQMLKKLIDRHFKF